MTQNPFSLPAVSLCSLTTGEIGELGLSIGVPMILGYLAGSHVRKFKDLHHRDVLVPGFNPPRWTFAPVWSVLYFMMGYSSYLVYMTGKVQGISVARPLAFYGLQLALNLCYPALLFRYRNPKVALYIITSTLVAALVTAYKFYYINEQAGKILIPYLVWLTFGGYVNKKIWRLNQGNKKLMKEKLFTYPSDAEAAQATIDIALKCKTNKKEE